MSATSETKYGLVFRQNGEDYLYIDQIGAGARGIVQLVQNTRTGELVVRKVSHPRLQAPRDTPLAVDLEAAVADYIKSNCPGRGPRINIAELLGHTVVRYPARSTTGNDKISHISYWKYYNLGNLSKFLQSQAGQKTITFALVARFIHQTLTAVALMYSLGIEHGDLHNRNIFLHLEPGSDAPDFYVGDFDHVRVSSSLAEIQHEKVEGCTSDLAALYANIQRLMFFANGLKPARLTEYEDLRSIKKDLGVLHTRFAAKQGSIRPLPQPEDLLALAARAKVVEIRYRAEQPLGLGASPCSTLVRAPKARYYEKQALMSQTFKAVVGPWHIAQIDIKNREILEIEEKTHLHCLSMGWDSDPGAPGNGGGSNEEEDEGDAYDWYMCGLGE